MAVANPFHGGIVLSRAVTAALLLAFSSCLVHAQVLDATVCEVLKNPTALDGKIVRIKATVSAGFDSFVLIGDDCGQHVNGIWLSYPEGTKAKSGPAAMLQLQPASNFAGTAAAAVRASVTLDRNKDFKQFDSLLSTPAKAGNDCLGCTRYQVSATLIGRLDGVTPQLLRENGKIVRIAGFGNLNAYGARLVLQSVSDVTAKEIDYTKPAPSKARGTTIANEFGTGASLREQPKRAIKAFGEPGDDNGVEVSGMQNEASPAVEAQSTKKSPDGVLFNCSFAMDRLKGDALGRAMAHVGEHVADLRTPEGGDGSALPYQLEFRAWVTTVLSAIGNGQKSLMLPGGYIAWNSSWSTSDLNDNTSHALSGYLSNFDRLSR